MRKPQPSSVHNYYPEINNLRHSPQLQRGILLVGGILFVLFILFITLINLPGGRTQSVLFSAPSKGSWHLARSLQKADIVSSAVLFRAATFLYFGKKLKSGEYLIQADDSTTDIVRKIVQGKVKRYRFTVPEGTSNYTIKESLRANVLLTGDIGTMPDEGTLLPETYFVVRGRSRQRVIAHMHSTHKQLVKRLWKKRAKGLPLQSIDDAVILASIVEKETGIMGERHEIAGVFFNRLNKKHYMQLQSDPTVIYALSRGAPFERPLTYQDLRADDPYNSYKNYGLPPGAISNPGRAALEAVLNPAKTKHFYFVADGTGGHVFAETYSEHLDNIQKWRAFQKKDSDEEDSELAENEKDGVAKN